MKKINILIIIIILGTCYSCHANKNADIKVCISTHLINANGLDEEYYVIYDKDTSACSFHFFSDAHQAINLEIAVCPSAKIYQEDYGIDRFIIPQEETLLHEMEACITEFKRKHKQLSLDAIHLQLIDFEQTAINTTQNCKFEKNKDNYKCIEKAILKTDFKSKIDSVLRPTNRLVSNIKCSGAILMVNKKTFIKGKNIHGIHNIPFKIIDVDVSLQLRLRKQFEAVEQIGQPTYPFIKNFEYHVFLQDKEAIPIIDVKFTQKGNVSIFMRYQTNKKYLKLSYKETLAFLSDVLEKLNKVHKLSQLQQIFLRTEMWSENSIYTSMEEYKKINIPHGEYFNKKAKKSRIVSDITKILSTYHLKITSLSYEDQFPLEGKVFKEINKNIELNSSEAYLTGNLILDISK